MEIVQEEQKVRVRKSIFHNRNFLFLFIAGLFSSPGYYAYLIGAEWLMLHLSENRFYFGMLFIAASIPRLVFLAVGGLIADRFNKRTILFLSDISRSLFILILLGLLWADAVMPIHLIIMAAFFGISDAFSYPALNALTPTILNEEELQKGNSYIQMPAQISPILGPALGGTFIAVAGFYGVFLLAFFMLLISAVAVLFIRVKHEYEEDHASAIDDLVAGFKYARNNTLISSIIITALFINFFFLGPFAIGIPLVIKDVFNGTAFNLAMVHIAIGVGSLVGTIFLALKTLKKTGVVLIASLIALGVFYTLFGLSNHLYITLAVAIVMAFLIQLINIPLMTMLQKTTDKNMLGRMMSVLMIVSSGLIPVSYLATSLLIAANVKIQMIMVFSGIIITIIGLLNVKNKVVANY